MFALVSSLFVSTAHAAEVAAQATTEVAAQAGGAEALAAFFDTKWGQYTLITVFFALIILYLRVLFGPKGFFREKKWDEWNEQARQKDAAEKEARKARLAEAAAEKLAHAAVKKDA